MILLGIDCKFFLVLHIILKTCKFNGKVCVPKKLGISGFTCPSVANLHQVLNLSRPVRYKIYFLHVIPDLIPYK